jgi:hypothetical protein
MSTHFDGEEPIAVAFDGDEAVADLYTVKAVRDCENSSWLRVERTDTEPRPEESADEQ